MHRNRTLFAVACAAGLALGFGSANAVMAQHRPDEQHEARRDLRLGAVRSLRDIEKRILPSMPGMQYLGPEFDPVAMAYRLKFIQDGRVVFVDVDARSGAILGKTR